ncbi:MAG: hypothetical protein QOG31_110, partial [Thermoplasmata archaeon]|nr:hypothetical protein [Thermoplasmata archaeon]
VLHLDANGDGFEDLSLPNAPTLSIQVPA